MAVAVGIWVGSADWLEQADIKTAMTRKILFTPSPLLF